MGWVEETPPPRHSAQKQQNTLCKYFSGSSTSSRSCCSLCTGPQTEPLFLLDMLACCGGAAEPAAEDYSWSWSLLSSNFIVFCWCSRSRIVALINGSALERFALDVSHVPRCFPGPSSGSRSHKSDVPPCTAPAQQFTGRLQILIKFLQP